ncbi:MAG: hypothetical protein AAF184_18435 [Pseudomonadota bacterium]
MLSSLRKAAARLLGSPASAGEPRRVALDDVPQLGTVYPELDTVTMTLRFSSPDGEHSTAPYSRTFDARTRANLSFRCKNPNCCQGGFELLGLIDRATASRRDSVTGTDLCAGMESPRGTSQRRCHHELHYRIAIRYRQH